MEEYTMFPEGTILQKCGILPKLIALDVISINNLIFLCTRKW